LSDRIGPGCGLRPFGRRQEELPTRSMPELMDQNSQAPWGVSEAFGNLGHGESLDEEGAEGLVLAVGGVGGFKEEASFLTSYL